MGTGLCELVSRVQLLWRLPRTTLDHHADADLDQAADALIARGLCVLAGRNAAWRSRSPIAGVRRNPPTRLIEKLVPTHRTAESRALYFGQGRRLRPRGHRGLPRQHSNNGLGATGVDQGAHTRRRRPRIQTARV